MSLQKETQLYDTPIQTNEDSHYIEVTVIFNQIIRTTIEGFHPQKTYIYKSGVKDSVRQPPDGYYKIGRQQVTEAGHRPNDLMLPPSDRAISRSHCQINYESFFNSTPPENWYAFMMCLHPRLGQRSVYQYLPIEIFRYIWLFIKQQRFPLLIDLGSMCGTFIKVSNTDPIVLVQGLNFLVGSDINIEIDRVKNDCYELEGGFQGNDTMMGDSDDDDQLPSVKIRVSKSFPDNETTMNITNWTFKATPEKSKYNIGRSQNCDINLPENTISRVQCRVFYDEKKWKLLDGSEGKPTVNGTWQSITKRINPGREASEPYPLKNGSQIKISDTILQIDWK
jgi:pSer/pThr/pTyr-binding forkhead associated (FHA) protein